MGQACLDLIKLKHVSNILHVLSYGIVAYYYKPVYCSHRKSNVAVAPSIEWNRCEVNGVEK